jgi:UDP-4-amino-4,6-dideoxy-N-acetyl-beta-L-altrosamine N-acetyltransferase
MKAILRPPRESEHQLLVTWRNESAQWFFSSTRIVLDGHLAWYARVEADPSQEFYVIEAEGQPVGTVGLTDIDVHHHRAEYGRLLIAPEFRRKGYGGAAMRALLNRAFGKMELHRVWGDVLSINNAALALDRKLGFQPEGVFRHHILKNGLWLDVTRMAMLEDEWKTGAR